MSTKLTQLTPAVQLEIPAVPPVEPTPPVVEGVKFLASERTPADWNIVPAGDDLIEATHVTTRKVFTGTIAEFSKALKG